MNDPLQEPDSWNEYLLANLKEHAKVCTFSIKDKKTYISTLTANRERYSSKDVSMLNKYRGKKRIGHDQVGLLSHEKVGRRKSMRKQKPVEYADVAQPIGNVKHTNMEKITKKRKFVDASPDKVIRLVSNGVRENDRGHKVAVLQIGNKYYYRKPVLVNMQKEDNGECSGKCQVDSQEVEEGVEKCNHSVNIEDNVTDEYAAEAQVDLQGPEEGVEELNGVEVENEELNGVEVEKENNVADECGGEDQVNLQDPEGEMEEIIEIEFEMENNVEDYCNSISDSLSKERMESSRVMEPEMEHNVTNEKNGECGSKSQLNSPEEKESVEKPTQIVKIEYGYEIEDDAGGSSDIEIIENPNLAEEEKITYLLTKEDFALLDRANMDSEYAKNLMTVLKQPYDEKEYERLSEQVKMYHKTYKSLKKTLLRYRSKPKKRLTIMRGLFYYMTNCRLDDSFRPWEHNECIDVEPGI